MKRKNHRHACSEAAKTRTSKLLVLVARDIQAANGMPGSGAECLELREAGCLLSLLPQAHSLTLLSVRSRAPGGSCPQPAWASAPFLPCC
jgi:hypothetical protein